VVGYREAGNAWMLFLVSGAAALALGFWLGVQGRAIALKAGTPVFAAVLGLTAAAGGAPVPHALGAAILAALAVVSGFYLGARVDHNRLSRFIPRRRSPPEAAFPAKPGPVLAWVRSMT
jgi:hypothetical protein